MIALAAAPAAAQPAGEVPDVARPLPSDGHCGRRPVPIAVPDGVLDALDAVKLARPAMLDAMDAVKLARPDMLDATGRGQDREADMLDAGRGQAAGAAMRDALDAVKLARPAMLRRGSGL